MPTFRLSIPLARIDLRCSDGRWTGVDRPAVVRVELEAETLEDAVAELGARLSSHHEDNRLTDAHENAAVARHRPA